MESESGKTEREACERAFLIFLKPLFYWREKNNFTMENIVSWQSLRGTPPPSTIFGQLSKYSYSLWTNKSWEKQNYPSLKVFLFVNLLWSELYPPHQTLCIHMLNP